MEVWNMAKQMSIDRVYSKDVVRAYLSSNLKQKDWCRENNIDVRKLKYRIRKFRTIGILDDLIERTPDFTLCGYAEGQYLTCNRENLEFDIHFVTKPLDSAGIDTVRWTIRSCLNRNPSCGDLFLFRKQGNRELIAYRSDGSITSYQKIRTGGRCIFRWPTKMADETHAFISRQQLEFIVHGVLPAGGC